VKKIINTTTEQSKLFFLLLSDEGKTLYRGHLGWRKQAHQILDLDAQGAQKVMSNYSILSIIVCI